MLREDGCRGLGLPRTFIRWLRFYAEETNNTTEFNTRCQIKFLEISLPPVSLDLLFES